MINKFLKILKKKVLRKTVELDPNYTHISVMWDEKNGLYELVVNSAQALKPKDVYSRLEFVMIDLLLDIKKDDNTKIKKVAN